MTELLRRGRRRAITLCNVAASADWASYFHMTDEFGQLRLGDDGFMVYSEDLESGRFRLIHGLACLRKSR